MKITIGSVSKILVICLIESIPCNSSVPPAMSNGMQAVFGHKSVPLDLSAELPCTQSRAPPTRLFIGGETTSSVPNAAGDEVVPFFTGRQKTSIDNTIGATFDGEKLYLFNNTPLSQHVAIYNEREKQVLFITLPRSDIRSFVTQNAARCSWKRDAKLHIYHLPADIPLMWQNEFEKGVVLNEEGNYVILW